MTETSSNLNGRQEIRRLLLELIDSVASGGTSETYGETTQYLDSLTELLSMWFDDLYRGADSLVTGGILNTDEARIVDEFSIAFDRAYPLKSYPAETNIRKLQDDTTWLSVVQAARDAQAKLRRLEPERLEPESEVT